DVRLSKDDVVLPCEVEAPERRSELRADSFLLDFGSVPRERAHFPGLRVLAWGHASWRARAPVVPFPCCPRPDRRDPVVSSMWKGSGWELRGRSYPLEIRRTRAESRATETLQDVTPRIACWTRVATEPGELRAASSWSLSRGLFSVGDSY
ncbi:mCG146330, isoform CRA_a, partial [Mus musculus]